MSIEEGIDHRVDEDGIVHVVFDRPGDKVNLLTPAILREIAQLLDHLRGRADVRGLVFESAKPGVFLAGMDVEQIAAVEDAYRASEAARFGQAVFQRIADLPVPTACAIAGTCLGGGTELALACTFRVAADDPRVRIGLPEVQLGIIPGFGGTQRLPRLVGLASALDLILTGRRLDAARAARIGLVDKVVPLPYLSREVVALLRAAAEDPRGTLRSLRPRRSLGAALLESVPLLRRILLIRARRTTAARVRAADYPAPFRALDAVDAAFSTPSGQGFDVEARLVGELVPTRTSKNLIWLFKSQTALKKAVDSGAAPRKVRRIAVLGAGIMGGGISQIAADRDLPVRLKDIRYEALLSALSTAGGIWRERIRKGQIAPREVGQRMALIAPTLDDRGLALADLVVEAVVEDLAVKQKVLAAAEERIGERAVFASNTSSIPITEIAAKALRPERVVGLHFFNPVHRMPLVEVIAGQRSSPEAMATVHRFAVDLGKTPVIVRDSPGFLVNRVLMPYLNEAIRLLSDGVRIEVVDAAATSFGMPMGPFALLDQVGLDTAHHVAHVLHAAFGTRIGPTTPTLGSLIAAERLGAKNGRGFYVYRNGRRAGEDGKVYALAHAPARRDLPVETLQERLVLAMVNEAALCLEEGVVREPRDVDVAMVLGTGFPAFRGRLLRHADDLGIAVVVDRLSRLADAQGERFRPARILREMVREQRKFYPA